MPIPRYTTYMRIPLLLLFLLSIPLISAKGNSEEHTSFPEQVNTERQEAFDLMEDASSDIYSKKDLSFSDSIWMPGDWTFNTNAAAFLPENAVLHSSELELLLTKGTGRLDRKYDGSEYYTPGQYFGYGKFEVDLKPSAPSGVITSFFLARYMWRPDYSSMYDSCEVDIEFVGTTKEVQFALHWSKPDGTLVSKAHTVKLDFDASESYKRWTIEWVPDRISFYVNDKELHTFNNVENINLPMEIHMNSWVTTSKEWAGPFNDSVLPISSWYRNLQYIPN